MANIFGGVEPPQWLQEIAKPIDATKLGSLGGLLLAGASNAARGEDVSFLQGVDMARKNIADPQWLVKEQALKTNAAANWARAASSIGRLQLTQADQAAWMRDLPKVEEFASLPLEQQIERPLTGMTSKQGALVADRLNRGAASSSVGKSMSETKTNYDKRVSDLIAKDPEAGIGLVLAPNQFPNKTNLQALALAEKDFELRRKMGGDVAAIEAEASGMERELKIGPTGDVTTTYKPKSEGVIPQQLDLGEGERIIYNPKSGHFVYRSAKGGEKNFTKQGLLDVAKAIEETDTERSNKIKQYLADLALEQLEGKPKLDLGGAPGLSFDGYKAWKEGRK